MFCIRAIRSQTQFDPLFSNVIINELRIITITTQTTIDYSSDYASMDVEKEFFIYDTSKTAMITTVAALAIHILFLQYEIILDLFAYWYDGTAIIINTSIQNKMDNSSNNIIN